ncbi:hypothetical protein ASD58_06525 [Duganella sp. Root1480D1]|nr:hypothetical protein ASD58_06525 [Duganella sp. Root1480D1]
MAPLLAQEPAKEVRLRVQLRRMAQPLRILKLPFAGIIQIRFGGYFSPARLNLKLSAQDP